MKLFLLELHDTISSVDESSTISYVFTKKGAGPPAPSPPPPLTDADELPNAPFIYGSNRKQQEGWRRGKEARYLSLAVNKLPFSYFFINTSFSAIFLLLVPILNFEMTRGKQ